MGSPEANGGDPDLLNARDEGVLALIERARTWFEGRGLALERVALTQTLGRLISEDVRRFALLAERIGDVELVTSSLRGAPLRGAVVDWKAGRS